MRNFSTLFLVIFISCNTPGQMGKVQYDSNGKVASGSSKTSCPPPSKRFTKALDIKLKAGFDSLAMTPKTNLELALAQTVTRLSDYSSEGLDIQGILYWVCVMANNRGFNAEEINNLMKTAGDAWNHKGSASISVINNGVNNGVMAGVFIGSQPRQMNETAAASLKSQIPVSAKVTITSVMGDGEAFAFATEVMKWMKQNGYSKIDGVNQAVYSQPVLGQSINKKPGVENEYEIVVGTKQ
jgi:spore coat protein CotF